MGNFDLNPRELTDLSDLSPRQRKALRQTFVIAAICICAIVANILVQGASPDAMRIAQANQAANVIVQ
ncbi:MAG: hypothetical protein J0H14_26635 [Alphaproteobacteria bacterium]|nr:hypothetical protein [Alphaproteobacteria bacterium]